MLIDLFSICYRGGRGAMGEHLMEYVQSTLDVAYYLEHMGVLFLQEAKHRSEPTLFVYKFMLWMMYVGVY